MHPKLWRCAMFGLKMSPFAQRRLFFLKKKDLVIKLISFIHAYLLNQNQRSKWVINLLMKYWRLKNKKLSTRFLPGMQFSQNAKQPWEFFFTRIPDKTADLIFLKSKKQQLLFGPFWAFLVILAWRWFFLNHSPEKNPALYI